MITKYSEIDEYFNKGLFDKEEKVEIKNDYALVLLFIKRAIFHLTEYSSALSWQHDRYWYSYVDNIDDTNIGQRHLTKDKFKFSRIRYKGGSLDIQKDSSQCVYITNGKKRKSLKVDDASGTVIVRNKWIKPLIVSDTETAVIRETNTKLQKFQNQLLIPYLTQKLVEAGITSYTANEHQLSFNNFGSGYYNTLRAEPVIDSNEEAPDDMELRKWNLTIRRDYYKNLPFYSVIAIIKGFYEAGYIK